MRIRGIFLVSMMGFVLGGCAQHVRHELVTGPDGRQAIAMRCGSMQHCYVGAGKLCPSGYDQISQASETRGGAIIGGYGGGAKSRAAMLIQCK